MKKVIRLAITTPLLTAIALSSFSASAAPNCAIKKAKIENQIKIAQQYNNVHRVAGLQRALDKVNTYCTDAGLALDVEKEVAKLEGKLNEKNADVAEIQAKLNEAKAQNNGKKVAKYQKKLIEKQADAEEIRSELEAVRTEITSTKE